MTRFRVERSRAMTALRATVVGASILSLAACSGARNIQSALPGGYLSDKSDACYSQRLALDNTGDTFETDLLENVVGGAVAGAVLGAITGAITGNNIGQSAAIGAAAGAVTGLAATYLNDLYERNNGNGVAVVQASISDVRRSNQQIDSLLAAFDALRDCRRREAQAVRDALAAGTIDEGTAQAEMGVIRAKYREDISHTRKIAENISKRTGEYASIYNNVAFDNSQPGLQVQPPAPAPVAASRAAEPAAPKPARKPRVTVVEKAPPKSGSGAPVITATPEVVTEHREVTTSNVAKRDQIYDAIAVAEADNDEFALS